MQSKLFSALAVASLFSVLTPLVPACNTQTGVKVTFYGYPDNSPPGGDISHDCGRGATAGGKFSGSQTLHIARPGGVGFSQRKENERCEGNKRRF